MWAHTFAGVDDEDASFAARFWNKLTAWASQHLPQLQFSLRPGLPIQVHILLLQHTMLRVYLPVDWLRRL